jgi:hypothetical protein
MSIFFNELGMKEVKGIQGSKQPFRFGKWRYDGRTDWADWADTNGFF